MPVGGTTADLHLSPPDIAVGEIVADAGPDRRPILVEDAMASTSGI